MFDRPKLIATAAAIYMSLMGKEGLREVATQSHSKAVYARGKMASAGCQPRLTAPFFDEFVIDLPADPRSVNRDLLKAGLIGGLPLGPYYGKDTPLGDMSRAMLVCVTEMNTRVLRDDGTVVLDGTAVCYTMPIPA